MAKKRTYSDKMLRNENETSQRRWVFVEGGKTTIVEAATYEEALALYRERKDNDK